MLRQMRKVFVAQREGGVARSLNEAFQLLLDYYNELRVVYIHML